MFFGSIRKTRWPPWSLIGWDIFDFSSESAEQNSTKLDRKQDLNDLYQVCVFWADQKNKMAALASDWLRHFRLLLWNRWTEFNETWQEARSQCPLPSLCFSGRSEKQDGRPSLWLAETFSTSPLKPLNGIQRNLTGSKISMSSTKFVFLGRSEKQDGRPGLWLAETLLTSPQKPLNGIQWNLTGSKISMPSTKFVFFGPIRKQKWPPWLIPQKGGTLFSGARYVALWASCFEERITSLWKDIFDFLWKNWSTKQTLCHWRSFYDTKTTSWCWLIPFMNTCSCNEWSNQLFKSLRNMRLMS